MANRPELEHFNEGYIAAQNGGDVSDCPYAEGGPMPWKYSDWISGYEQYFVDLEQAALADEVDDTEDYIEDEVMDPV